MAESRRLRTQAERDADGPARRVHDSDAWETVSGWLWSCRTCLAKGWADSETDAQEKRAKHDVGPVPWWVVRMSEDK